MRGSFFNATISGIIKKMPVKLIAKSDLKLRNASKNGQL